MKIVHLKKNIIFLLIFSLILIGCNNKYINDKIQREKIKNLEENVNIFKNNSVESVVKQFQEISKKNKIKIDNFEKLNYDGRVFYYSKIRDKKGISYMMEYTGFDIGGLFLKMDSITGENLSDLEKFILNLISISDLKIDENEAKELYTQLLLNIPEKENFNIIEYNNGLKYGLKIDRESEEFIFFIQ